jgi:hypothetical protein
LSARGDPDSSLPQLHLRVDERVFDIFVFIYSFDRLPRARCYSSQQETIRLEIGRSSI